MRACRPCAAPPSSGWSTRSSRDRAGPRPPCSRYGMLRVGILQPLRDPHAEQVLGLEVGGVQRIDVGADGAADRPRQRRAGRRSPRSHRAPASAASGPWPRCPASSMKRRRSRPTLRASALAPGPALPASWISATVCCRVWSMRMLDGAVAGLVGRDRRGLRASRRWRRRRSRRRGRRRCPCRRCRGRPAAQPWPPAAWRAGPPTTRTMTGTSRRAAARRRARRTRSRWFRGSPSISDPGSRLTFRGRLRNYRGARAGHPLRAPAARPQSRASRC